jgi:glycosyltransferase involved in cell wall biosynthesis
MVIAPRQTSHGAEPLVSVVLPTHNRADLLRRAISSVLAQTHRALELIVVDDASTDHTPDVVATCDDSRLRYVRLERNRRAAAARNVGIRLARGELVAFQDDDDIWLIDKLRQQVARMKTAPLNVVLCLCGHFWVSDAEVRIVGNPEVFTGLDFRRGPLGGFGLIATPSWLVRRASLERAGLFDERMQSLDDWELALRLKQLGNFQFVDKPLFIHDRAAGGAMWRNRSVFSSDMRLILAKHGELWRGAPEMLAPLQLVVAKSEAEFHSLRESRIWLLRSLRLDPRQPKAWILLAATMMGRHLVHTAITLWRRVAFTIRGRR